MFSSLSRTAALSVLFVLVLASGCAPSGPAPAPLAPGEVQLAVTVRDTLAGEGITRVTVTVSAVDLAPMTSELTLSKNAWSGQLAEVPAGAHRLFVARAFDASGTLRYEGRAVDLTVTAQQTLLVSITLQELAVPAPFENEAPIIDALAATPGVVAPGAQVALSASAHDPNPDDALSYSWWSSSSGEFSDDLQSETTWTAPEELGSVVLWLSVRDSRGATTSRSLTVRVADASGSADVAVGFNRAPRIPLILTLQYGEFQVGRGGNLLAFAVDPDGDPLTYAWSATCAGSFRALATQGYAAFTPTMLPAGDCNNCRVTVTASDGRGGQASGSLSMCVTQAPHPHWEFTGAMADFRANHTATPLLNGEVLVVGGRREDYTQSFNTTVEVYNPVSGTWRTVAPLVQGPRANHLATRLADGRVLVLSGEAYGVIRSAEVYDPMSGTWSVTGPMVEFRRKSTATLLADGRVLVAGGTFLPGQASAEVYDPATNTWSQTGAMFLVRDEHTATRLSDGRVLVVGGRGSDSRLAAELYDPASGTWSPTQGPRWQRMSHTATLLPTGEVLIAGTDSTQEMTLMAELYDPAQGTWRSTGPMIERRWGHEATLLPDGKVLVMGGTDELMELTTTELYDPATGRWSVAGAQVEPRWGQRAALLPGGKVLVAGGYRANAIQHYSSAELYTP